jgi:hypothetical protein
MSRKHYIAIAAAIKSVRAEADPHDLATTTADEIAYKLASILKQDNAAFDRVRFLDACGVVQA